MPEALRGLSDQPVNPASHTMATTNFTSYGAEQLGRFGVFVSSLRGAAVQRRNYQDELCSPVQLIATASDSAAAAMAACCWLAQLDRTDDATKTALIIRDRDARRNVALIQWVQRFSAGGEYRYSAETWAHEAVRVPVRAGRERLAMA